MPTISINRAALLETLGFNAKGLTEDEKDKEFDQLCFDFGIELDEITSEKAMKAKEHGATEADNVDASSDEIIYRIEIGANRYDLLCFEGLARALRIFQGKVKDLPNYTAVPAKDAASQVTVTVTKDAANGPRPYIVAAVLRGVTFTQASLDSFIDLQDRLHQNICRKRSLVAIGTHDLDKMAKAPSGGYAITYDYELAHVDGKPSDKFRFSHLGASLDSPMHVDDMLRSFVEPAGHHLAPYVPLIRTAANADDATRRFPVVRDTACVISLPPVINSERSKITLDTRDILVECTATDLTKAIIVLNTMLCMFSEYCADAPYTCEQVTVTYESPVPGSPVVRDTESLVHTYPDFALRPFRTTVAYINSRVGIDIDAAEACMHLQRMGLQAEHLGDGHLAVSAPATRSDILHECDIMEDVAVSFGINNIPPPAAPPTATAGSEQPLNQLSDLVRRELAFNGLTEALTFSLVSAAENSTHLCPGPVSEEERQRLLADTVILDNPATREFEVVRTSLLPGLFKTIACSSHQNLPIKLFEVSDVVLKDASMEVGAVNRRLVAGAVCSQEASFEEVHGILDRVMAMLDVKFAKKGDEASGYYVLADDDPAFLPGQCAKVMYKGQKIGQLGVLHPQVNVNFGISYPLSAFQFNLEHFV
ncbi:phenylalanyl-tRNA synthetase, beta subunit [Fonticula alba]|uniref:phenylalanine--tRNA ligase n=1 Tax=Fonticula alba TaxID=691883 RepID=A0A058Z232_FONAL|nr:phenylalanyl-tRNA synthetase, beta subunit [Fonticula alba]KCV68344.1 phenylalanyl-tRNA synthetase, beta subunit [Fonticula alba]|eukprot:XP_009497398.1 phenylalanyl-tRNA synthetase, beta subunit [Fonticula alba]